ncbi:unnamed protein product, partial [Hapterophycus canaliculatus]
QNPYVKITLGSKSDRSNSVVGGRSLCDWAHEALRCRLESGHAAKETRNSALVVEVWNENQARRDALIGRGVVRPETLRQLHEYPSEGGVSCRVKISRRGKGREG